MSTATLEHPPAVDGPEGDRLSHIILTLPGAAITFPAVALCGFVCTRLAPDTMPRCPECDGRRPVC